MDICSAILILGPTGVGKTPLGDYYARYGLWGKTCHHFDFGSELRKIVKNPNNVSILSNNEIKYLIQVLETGALLTKNKFPIAQKILSLFLENFHKDDLLLLNGLPRHLDQAKALESLVTIKQVIYLHCSAPIIKDRIQRNSGGDRFGRIDDSLEFIDRKIRIFIEKTLPLVDYYQQKKVPITTIPVLTHSTPQDILRILYENQKSY